MNLSLSVVVPVFDERGNLAPLVAAIHKSLSGLSYEVILVDDGSTDGSSAELERLVKTHPHMTAIFLARRYGQTSALAAGFKEARGEFIAALDADGQNDPEDIRRLMAQTDQGFDVVSGWREQRQDPFWSRRLPSWVANRIIAWTTGVPLHDFGCTLKIYRRSALEGLRLYGEMHRLLPAWCVWRGARITEIPVQHHPRTQGRSKYGMGRTFKVLLDLFTAKFIGSYFTKPNYVFGGFAFVLYCIALLSALIAFYDKLGPNAWPALRVPLLLLTCLAGIVGTLLMLMGLIAEMLVRVYYEITDEYPYRTRQVLRSAE